MGSASVRKGKAWERRVAADLRQVLPADLKERIERGAIRQARDGAADSDVTGLPGFWLEAKAEKRTNPRAALRQAVEASRGSGRIPVAVCKDDNRTGQADPVSITVTFCYADFLALIAALGRSGFLGDDL